MKQKEKELEEFKNAQEIINQKAKDEQIYRNELSFKLDREKEKLIGIEILDAKEVLSNGGIPNVLLENIQFQLV